MADDFLKADAEAPDLGGDEVTVEPLPSMTSSSGYWVSISSRTGFRRLHRCGGCWYRAEETEMIDDPSSARFNARCGVCWKEGRQSTQKKLISDMKDDVDSSVGTDSETSSSEK